MTLLDTDVDAATEALADDRATELVSPGPRTRGPGETSSVVAGAEATAPRPVMTAATAALSASAAAVLVGGLFIGASATLVALAAVAAGAGLVALSYRFSRAAPLQWAALPLLAALGALVASFNSGTGARDPLALVTAALRAGGIAQPPAPFDPGWQILTVLLLGGLTAGTTMVAVSYRVPKVAVFGPAPLTFGVLLLQPAGGGQLRTVAALALLVLALVLGFGVDTEHSGGASTRFQARRMARGVGGLAVLLAVVVGITQLDFLFPPEQETRVVPPQKPKPPPPEPDRDLFDVTSPVVLPWRVGTLDVYDGHDWLTPPLDSSRLRDLAAGGDVAGAVTAPKDRSVTVTFTLRGLHTRDLPSVLGAYAIRRADGTKLQVDPRTQVVRLKQSLPHDGQTYTVDALAPPTADALRAAPKPGAKLRPFLTVPAAPPRDVQAILDAAPDGPLYDRLQFVRAAYYKTLVGAGPGKPASMTPKRIVELLHGKPASPYEITAAEAVLARWAGIPARFGFGYYDGDSNGKDVRAVHPRHAATWLEVYFEGVGWTPFVGTPPRARGSLDSKNPNPTVRPAEDLALTVYVPVQLQSVRQLYDLARFWALRVLPWVIALALALWAYPFALKALRRTRRARWAARRGPRERIAVAYLEYRDLAFDLNIGGGALTPLEFLKVVAPDEDHTELAWLVTRALWGDLQRGLSDADAIAAEETAASLRRRLSGAQPPFNRVLAAVSRASLRKPTSPEIPNLWWPPRRRLRAPRRALTRLGPATSAAALALVLLLGGCARDLPLEGQGFAMPARVVPPALGDYAFERVPKAETAYARAGSRALVNPGEVFLVKDGLNALASVQIAPFKQALVDAGRQRELRDSVTKAIGGQNMKLKRVGDVVYRVHQTADRKIYVYLPPDMSYMFLLVARPTFDDADHLLAALVDYQRGVADTTAKQVAELPDPLRGIDP